MPRILSVSELTRNVADVLESEFPFVRVEGEVTNLARPGSGHIYFSLTDGNALLDVVWFKSSQFKAGDDGGYINPMTGEVEEEPFHLEDGQSVLCAGRINVYAPRGRYQLVAEMVQPEGIGDLLLKFEVMKAKLAAQGYFDEDRKLSLPMNPARVAVVTAPAGAAIRDFLRIAHTRGTASEIRIYPVLVQGDAAPGQIARAVEEIESDGWAEVIVLIRGGGSIEDLWAFNTETTADAIFNSRTPVLSGVGHEVDFTIADMTADKRAATPTHAAMELWPEREHLLQRVDTLEMSMTRAFDRFMERRKHRLAALARALDRNSPLRRLERTARNFERVTEKLVAAGKGFVQDRTSELSRIEARLLRAYGPHAIERKADRVREMSLRFERAAENFVNTRIASFRELEARFTALDPEKPLERGYSLVTVRGTGMFLRGPDEVRPGDPLDIKTRDGMVAARVDETPNKDNS